MLFNGYRPTFSYHVFWQPVPRKVLHILVVLVDYFREFAPVHHLLKHPHFHGGVKIGIAGGVGSHDLGNGRTPVLLTVTV